MDRNYRGKGLRRPIGLLATIPIAALVTVACGPRIIEEHEVELIESRVDPCIDWCTLETDEACGMGETPAYEGFDECVEECATVGGMRSAGWGYQLSTDRDLCVPEWQAHYECVAALSCTDQLLYFTGHPDGEGPDEDRVRPEDRACFDVWNTMSRCERAVADG